MAFTTEQRLSCGARVLEALGARGLSLGDRVPGETVLCREIGATRHMVRLALGDLTEEGFIERRGRSGTYLIREPDAGPVRAAARSTAPVKYRSSTISLMLVNEGYDGQLRGFQERAMARGFMLHTYFASEHASSAEEERKYLEQAVANGYRGAVIHPTPLEPGNDAFFRRAAAQLRLAHIDYHGPELPEQSFFLPDYRFAGAACLGYLADQGCREVCHATTMPEGHHLPGLVYAGMEAAAGTGSPELSAAYSVLPWRDEARAAMASWLRAGPRLGLVVYSAFEILDQMIAAEPDPGKRPWVIAIADEGSGRCPKDVPAYVFSWGERVRAALDFIMADDEALEHRLYLPGFRPGTQSPLPSEPGGRAD